MRRSRFETFQVAPWVLAGATVVLLSSCAGFRHGATLVEYQGQILKVDGPGRTRLDIEADYDPSVRNAIAQNGEPDYIVVESSSVVKLVYVADDRVLVLERGFTSVGTLRVVEPISDSIAASFTSGDRRRLQSARSDAQADNGEAVPTPSAATESSAPAGNRAATPEPRATPKTQRAATPVARQAKATPASRRLSPEEEARVYRTLMDTPMSISEEEAMAEGLGTWQQF